MERFLTRFVQWTRPFVWRIAGAYQLRIDKHLHSDPDHPLIIEDGPEAAKEHIPNSVIFNTRGGAIRVGCDTIFGHDVLVITGTHMNIAQSKKAGVPLHHLPNSGHDIRIGKGCFIASRAIIIGPVEIGDYVTVSAGTVVNRDIPSYAVVSGVPARIVTMLNEEALQ